MVRWSIFLLMCLVLNLATGETDYNQTETECSRVRRCKKGHRGPAVHFPFRLRGHHPPNCGLPDPAFELSCDESHHTVLNLPRSAKLFVKGIEIYNPHGNGCFQQLILNNPHLNMTESPFSYNEYDDYGPLVNVHIYNCSAHIDEYQDYEEMDCLSIPGYAVRGVDPQEINHTTNFITNLIGCSNIGVTPPIPSSWTREAGTYLQWSAVPNCTKCEQKGRGCRFKRKSINNSRVAPKTECFHLELTGSKRKRLVIGVMLGSFFLLVAAIGLFHIHSSYELKKKNEIKIKQFLDDYKSLKATRYSYADIKIITNQFNQELGQGAFGTVYKGQLANNILVAVKFLTSDSTRNGEEFINEVASMGRIHHVNVARLVGFCADGAHRALVYEFLPNKSLEKFIFQENEEGKRVVLGLEKLQDIALGIAKGMEYLHHGCDQQILHFDIKPHNILLDQNFVPKISDFGLAKLCSKEKSVVTMTAARGTMGYIAPEVASKNFGKPSYKSDVYSYGMLLLEMVGGRKNIDISAKNSSQVYFPEWVYKHVDQGEELRIDIEDEGQAKIVKKLAIVALKCIQWHPMDRPSMKVVIQMLEGEADNLIVPPNPFASTDQRVKKIGNRPTRPQNLELEIISEAE